jgi:hypothetical protein
VTDPDHATMLLERIHQEFAHYRANFDLDDCDNILRVVSSGENVDTCILISFLQHHGFHAEVLPDV